MAQAAETKKWHVAQWGFLGWLETGIKFVGIVAGWIAFANSLSALGFSFRSNPRLAAVIAFVLLALPTLAVPLVRVAQREVISVIYSIFNLTGHVAMLIALLRTPQQQLPAIIFGLAYAAGELVKQRYLVVSGYTENGATPKQMLTVSRVLMAIYLLFAVLMFV